MKKFICVLVFLALVNVANAGMIDIVISSLNDVPINPVKEITIGPTDWINMDVIWTGDTGRWLFGMSLDVVAEGVPVTLDGSAPTWPPGIWDPSITEIISHDGMIGVSAAAAANGLPAPGGIAVDHILLHCDGPGDVPVIVRLVENPNLPSGFTAEADADFNLFFDVVFGPGVIIHQIPEPMTLTLLGLGGLFLARRKK